MNASMERVRLKVRWVDGKREHVNAPDPRHPQGIDIDVSFGAPHCASDLPYPAKRVGHFYVECQRCGANLIVSTAGRTDDPRSVKLPCKLN